MNLGEKISLHRKNRGLSQELLAENCGVSLRTIQRLENNKSKPRPYTLKVIADALNIRIEELEDNTHSEFAKDGSLAKINLINSSALLGVLFPLFNIIAPVFIWKIHRKHPSVNEKGKRIISFQILWSFGTLFILLITHVLNYKITGQFVTGRVSILIIAYILLLIVNVFFVLQNSIQLKRANIEIYSSFPNLF